MAARKTSYLRKVPNYSQGFGYGEFGYGGKISSGVYSKYGRKRGEFESNISYEIDNVVVNSSPRKRRKFAPVNPVIVNRRRNICDDLGEKCSSRVPRFSKSRWVYDDDLGNKGISRAPRFSKSWWAYDDDFGEKGISRVPRFSKSWWVYNDGGLDECSWVEKDGVVIKAAGVKERRLSPRIGVIEKEGLDGECVMRVYSDDCMKVDVSDDKGCVTSESDLDYSDEGFEGGVSRVGREIMQPQGCRSVVEYEKLSKISEGSYGIVYEARDKRSGDIVALKKMKLGNGGEGFPMCYLREISILMSINHPSIVNVREVVVDDCINGFDSVYLVMDYLEHDIRKLVKCLMLQLLEGVEYLHDNRVFHRDLKTANLLFNNKGELKIFDFGLSCRCESLLKPCTSVVVTIWYRAPELLLGAREYSTAVDMCSVGCIMAELLTGQPLFNGNTEVEQIGKIFSLLGTPNDHIWPGYSKLPGVKANFVHQPYNLLHERFPRSSFIGSSSSLSDSGLDLLSRLLTYDPEKRITAKEVLNHCWFQEVPPPCSKEYMPTFPAIL